jgi:hypothetical protein
MPNRKSKGDIQIDGSKAGFTPKELKTHTEQKLRIYAFWAAVIYGIIILFCILVWSQDRISDIAKYILPLVTMLFGFTFGKNN